MFKSVEPHPNFPAIEEEILKFWEKEKIFEKSLEKTTPLGSARGEFVFYDGPPFATGLPHYGHILASTIKDVVPRYQTMKGKLVRRRWGWDCHGLPIEEIVERKLKISGKKEIEKLGIAKFNETCRSEVMRFAEEWGKMVARIARWVDFENSYQTMDRTYMESVWWAFKEIYKKGLVYEGRKVLLYCPRCETPVSNFEVAMDNSYQTITEESVIVKFQIRNPNFQKFNPKTFILSWTTTPWTLIGNVALAVNPSIKYLVLSIKGENYIIAKDLAEKILNTKYEIHDTIPGKDLVGLEYEPLFEVPEVAANPKSYKVYAGDFVTTEEGTGIVHTAVVYGEEDYELGLREGLPVVPLLDEKGRFNDKAPQFVQGLYFKDAEEAVKHDLAKRGLLFERKMHSHSYPHCWRCGTMLFYNAIPAWFIEISKIKSQLLKSNEKEINWYPRHLKFGRYAKSVEAAPDWNISRNRYWGNPIPVWRCEKCKEMTVIGSVQELKEKAVNFSVIARRKPKQSQDWIVSSQAPRNDDITDLHRPYIDEVVLKCDECGGEAKRIMEIFDSWFEAASMPFAEHHYPFENQQLFASRMPAQLVAEYIAQTRAWFYVMHVVSLILFGRAPFENVVTTGTILNEKGEKLSKSRKNFPDPWKIIDKYGVDSLRFYLMSSVVMQGDDLFFNERDLANVYRRVILILWNVYNYFVTYANQAKWTPASSPPIRPPKAERTGGEREGVLDHWILARLRQLVNEVTEYLDSYDTVRATREIERFINDLSTWYLRRSRGRNDKEFFVTLREVLFELSKIIAPFMPYLAEAIYRNLQSDPNQPDADSHHSDRVISVHLADWPKTKKLTKQQEELLAQMQELRKIVEEVHALRAKAGIKLRQPLLKLTIPSGVIAIRQQAEKQSQVDRRGLRPRDDRFAKLLNILKDELNVLEIGFGKELRLDTKITPELKLAGLARELERQINQFRKESGLKIGGYADLIYEAESDMIEKALKKVDRKKIYVMNVRKGKARHKLDIEGQELLISLKISN